MAIPFDVGPKEMRFSNTFFMFFGSLRFLPFTSMRSLSESSPLASSPWSSKPEPDYSSLMSSSELSSESLSSPLLASGMMTCRASFMISSL